VGIIKCGDIMENNKTENIITINSDNRELTDEDVNNLIWGLVGLIRSTTKQRIVKQYKLIIDDYNVKLNGILEELNNKNKLLNTAIIENQKLKEKNNNINKLLNKIKGK
jgi:membrane-anchored protein YejM (alkaline phosphatase superfamily)